MTDSILLVADIGGTNARFALADPGQPGFSNEATLQCADFATADDAIQHYLADVGAAAPDVICLAAAGPVIDQVVKFTNNPWRIAADDLATKFPDASIRLLNDFEAIAYSIPFLSSGEYLRSQDEFTIAIVGPGTGLGTAGLKKSHDVLVPILSEASHKGFAPETNLQRDVLEALLDRFGRVSVERLVSGVGLENLYWALAQVRKQDGPALSVAEIFSAAQGEASARVTTAVNLFFEVLGQFAGDIALAFGAKDGVFIAGGIVRRYPELFAASPFRSGFENKGRYRSHMEEIPTHLILHPQPGLLGASYVALELLRGTEVMPTS
jgi:glucokinase